MAPASARRPRASGSPRQQTISLRHVNVLERHQRQRASSESIWTASGAGSSGSFSQSRFTALMVCVTCSSGRSPDDDLDAGLAALASLAPVHAAAPLLVLLAALAGDAELPALELRRFLFSVEQWRCHDATAPHAPRSARARRGGTSTPFDHRTIATRYGRSRRSIVERPDTHHCPRDRASGGMPAASLGCRVALVLVRSSSRDSRGRDLTRGAARHSGGGGAPRSRAVNTW